MSRSCARDALAVKACASKSPLAATTASTVTWCAPSIETSRIRGELGYKEPIAQDDAIRRTIEWERANPTESSPHAFDYDAEDVTSGTT